MTNPTIRLLPLSQRLPLFDPFKYVAERSRRWCYDVTVLTTGLSFTFLLDTLAVNKYIPYPFNSRIGPESPEKPWLRYKFLANMWKHLIGVCFIFTASYMLWWRSLLALSRTDKKVKKRRKRQRCPCPSTQVLVRD